MRALLFVFITIFVSEAALSEDFISLAKKCAPEVSLDTLIAVIKTESSFNQYAIGVVGGQVKQPTSLEEAKATVEKLQQEHKNYSLGLGQINQANFKSLGLKDLDLFDPCTNLKATQKILGQCYKRVADPNKNQGRQLADALSCYYSGNIKTGYEHGYVQSVVKNNTLIPSIELAKKELERSSFPQSTSIINASSVVTHSKEAQGFIF